MLIWPPHFNFTMWLWPTLFQAVDFSSACHFGFSLGRLQLIDETVSQVCIVMEQMLRLLHYCGLPVEDVDFINSDGKTMNKLLLEVSSAEFWSFSWVICILLLVRDVMMKDCQFSLNVVFSCRLLLHFLLP